MQICFFFRIFVRLNGFRHMKRNRYISILLLITSLLCGCDTLRFVPEGKNLLKHVNVVVVQDSVTSMTKSQRNSLANDMRSYLRQTPNTLFLGFWPLQLNIYNTAPKDTLTKSQRLLRANAFRMGEAPEIYDESRTAASLNEITKAMQGLGWFNAYVDTFTIVKKRRVQLTYMLHPGEPYYLRSYLTDLNGTEAITYANDGNSLLAAGQQFNVITMDRERQRIASLMRNQGYYYYEKDILDFEADSSWGCHEVALKMQESKLISNLPDSIHNKLYQKMYISRVVFHQDCKHPLRENTLRKLCPIHEGSLYNEHLVERAIARLNGLEAIKYVDVSFRPVAQDSMECHITLTKGKQNSFSAEIEGTFSGGDWGIQGEVSYANKNIFRGAEKLTINTRVGYEWRQYGGRAIEGRLGLGVKWPNSLDIDIGAAYQRRPDEYARTMANATLGYTYQPYGSDLRHSFNLLDINYIRMGFITDSYRKLIEKTGLLSYRFQDNLIVGWSYTGFYSGRKSNTPQRTYANVRYSVETAGNVLYGIGKALNLPRNKAGQQCLFGVAYTQYAKGEIDVAIHHMPVPKHELVYHMGAGIIYPYGNEVIAPFEKRYFSGGPNGVRGWQSRTLGPGGYSGTDGQLRYDLQTGDIRLDFNLEYRWKVWNFIELAAFTDAGNIWTIKDYESQPHGLFKWNTFYKQIAWSYGIGLRLDLSVLIFRIDLGTKLYDPTRLYTDGKVWRTAPNGLAWSNGDFTLHFAIGYPF